MSHACKYVDGECETCAAEVEAAIESDIRSQCGRWMVVQDDAMAYRYARKSLARYHVRMCRESGVGARLLRWRRDRAEYVYLGFEVTDRRWLP